MVCRSCPSLETCELLGRLPVRRMGRILRIQLSMADTELLLPGIDVSYVLHGSEMEVLPIHLGLQIRRTIARRKLVSHQQRASTSTHTTFRAVFASGVSSCDSATS